MRKINEGITPKIRCTKNELQEQMLSNLPEEVGFYTY